MPTLYCRSTTIQLSISGLTLATTAYPVPHQSREARDNIQHATEALVKGSRDGTLTEDPLYSEKTQSHISFLGKNQDMPFFMVHAGKDYFDSQNNKRGRNRRVARSPLVETNSRPAPGLSSTGVNTSGSNFETGSNIQSKKADDSAEIYSVRRGQSSAPVALKPQALCLTVFLSNASFLRTYDAKTAKTTISDIKINVYFNGELCGSTYISERYRGEAFTMSELIVRFSGRRVGRILEKPWVMIPRTQIQDGALRDDQKSNNDSLGIFERWNALSDVLNKQAKETGRNKNGELSVGGEYLLSLAKLAMPIEMKEMRKDDGFMFGVIDVVVISGRGQKDDSSYPYLLEPTLIRSEGCGTEVNRVAKVKQATSVPKEKQRKNTVSRLGAQVFFTQDPGSTNDTNPRVTPQVSAGRKAVPDPELDIPQLSPTKPSTAPRYSRGRERSGSFDVIDESSFSLVKDSQTHRRASVPISRPQSSQDPHHNTKYLSKPSTGQKNPDTHVNPGPRRRSGLLNELAALVSDTTTRSLRLGEPSLSTRLRRPAAKPQTSTGSLDASTIHRRTSLPARPRRPAMSPGSHLSGRAHLSHNVRARSRNDEEPFAKRLGSSSPERHPRNAPQKRYKGPSPSPSPKEPQPKRARFSYEMVLDDKRTLAEEIATIEEEAQRELAMAAADGSHKPARATRATYASTAASAAATSPTTAAPNAASLITQTAIIETSITKDPTDKSPRTIDSGDTRPSPSPSKAKLKLNAPAPSTATKSSPFSSSPSHESRLPEQPTPPKGAHVSSPPAAPNVTPASARTSAQGNPVATKPTPDPSPTDSTEQKTTRYPSDHLRRPYTSTALSVESIDNSYEIPELSRDCAIGYAGPGVLRQVRGERGGWFEEEGVLMGVRFVVG